MREGVAHSIFVDGPERVYDGQMRREMAGLSDSAPKSSGCLSGPLADGCDALAPPATARVALCHGEHSGCEDDSLRKDPGAFGCYAEDDSAGTIALRW